jgi:hypothetical protein
MQKTLMVYLLFILLICLQRKMYFEGSKLTVLRAILGDLIAPTINILLRFIKYIIYNNIYYYGL